jgi:hypothetical protein
VLESGYYLWHYFTVYPAETVWAFESYDFPRALSVAQAQHPEQIIVSDHSNQAYAHLDFYSMTHNSPSHIPTTIGDPIAQPGTCIIYFTSDETIYDADKYQVSFSQDEGYSEVKCFK